MTTAADSESSPTGVSRRRVLGVGGAAVGGVVVGGLAGGAIAAAASDDGPSSTDGSAVPFRGEHQAGIVTPVQDRLLFASFDLTTNERSDVMALLRQWTSAAERLTQGEPVAGTAINEQSPPDDTGEAAGLPASQLTLTFGFGPGFFTTAGTDRFGVADKRPAPLVDLPAFPRDNLDATRSGGDLCVQACGNDPQVLFHAIRNLARIGRGTVRLRWSQEGFGRTSSTGANQSTARNLMGFKDGTDNLRSGDAELNPSVWVAKGDDPDWMVGGSYLVVRRIRIHIEVWDRSALADQEATLGRVRASGAPLGGHHEFDAINLAAKDAHGQLEIPAKAHVRVANQKANDIHILRRGYNFTDGLDPAVGQLDAGLFFLAYQRDTTKQFIPLQNKLAMGDALNEYIEHVASAHFAIPPGVGANEWIGGTLLG
jgi:deferrochelatase/peroxidase EfeB